MAGPDLVAAAVESTDFAVASIITAVLAGVAGILTALATRSRSATDGYRDLVDQLQQERDRAYTDRDTALAACAAAVSEQRRLEVLLLRAGVDAPPPDREDTRP